MGEILVLNDDEVDLDVDHGGEIERGGDRRPLRDANAEACAA